MRRRRFFTHNFDFILRYFIWFDAFKIWWLFSTLTVFHHYFWFYFLNSMTFPGLKQIHTEITRKNRKEINPKWTNKKTESNLSPQYWKVYLVPQKVLLLLWIILKHTFLVTYNTFLSFIINLCTRYHSIVHDPLLKSNIFHFISYKKEHTTSAIL